jgi:hypothetical protein
VTVIVLKGFYSCRNWTSTGRRFLKLKVEEGRYMTIRIIVSTINRIQLVGSRQEEWDYVVPVGEGGSAEKNRKLSNGQFPGRKHRWERNRKIGPGGTIVEVDSQHLAKFRTEWSAGWHFVFTWKGVNELSQRLLIYKNRRLPKELGGSFQLENSCGNWKIILNNTLYFTDCLG